MTALSKKQMLDVMAYADGELSGADADRVAALIEENPDARELVRSLGALGDFVRETEGSRSIDVIDQVMGRIGPSDIERARLKRAARMRTGAVIVTLTALAAGVLLWQRSRTDDTAKSRPVAPPRAALAQTGVQVEQVDSPQSVSVFYVSDEEANPPTTVVWIDDTTE
jgi:anti-sigma factor RsiW